MIPLHSLPPVSTKNEPTSDQEFDELDDDFESDTQDPNVFNIHGALEEPVYQLFTTSQLHTFIHQSVIDLDPPYQRDVVWTEAKQIHLIDSLFHNKYVPPVLFAVREDAGDEVRVCVDGKQRLTSIQKFLDGQIPFRDPKSKKLWYNTHPDPAKEIPLPWKKAFANKKIVCMEYHDISNADERDIFQRVQMGISLSAAEKLQAISSPWSQWISTLEAKHVSVDNGLAQVLNWDTKRGRDFQNIAFLVHCCDGYPQAEYIPTAAKIEKWLSRVDSPPDGFKTAIERTLNDFWRIATDKELNHGLQNIGSRVAPIEFIFVGVLLFATHHQTLQFRAGAITVLRERLRAVHKDVRANSGVSKTAWQIIRAIQSGKGPEYNHINVASRAKGKKRKKGDEDEDEDEYRPAPITSLGKANKTRSRR